MKKVSFAVASILSVSALTLTPVVASADPVGLNVDMTCPAVKGGGTYVITNHGNGVIAGMGREIIQNAASQGVLFKTTTAKPETPAKLNNYDNASADYDSTTGTVTCNYTSSLGEPAEPNISVEYTLTNGKGGSVLQKSNDSISFLLPVGFRK